MPTEVRLPPPGPDEILIRVEACGVCRTDLHLLDNELPDIHCPVTPGHEIVGVVADRGRAVSRFAPGDRVGVPWLAWTDGTCEFCRAGLENLPGLGLEGELVSAWGVSRLIAGGQPRRDPLRREVLINE